MDKIMEFLPFMLEGTVLTVELFVLTLILSLPLGLPIALGSNSRIKPLSWLCKIYVWIFRGTPLLLQLFFFYFFFPLVLNIQMNVFFTVVLTYVLNYAAYFAEIYRGGINSIDRGQYEAAFQAADHDGHRNAADYEGDPATGSKRGGNAGQRYGACIYIAGHRSDEGYKQCGKSDDGYDTVFLCCDHLSDHDFCSDHYFRTSGKIFLSV